MQNVIVTHLHYDHIGNFDLFPAATFHLQEREMYFATGRHMGDAAQSGAYAPLARPLFVYVKRASAQEAHTRAFLEFILDNEAEIAGALAPEASAPPA